MVYGDVELSTNSNMAKVKSLMYEDSIYISLELNKMLAITQSYLGDGGEISTHCNLL